MNLLGFTRSTTILRPKIEQNQSPPCHEYKIKQEKVILQVVNTLCFIYLFIYLFY